MATLLLCYLCLSSAATAILSWSHHTTRPFVPLTRLNSFWLLTSADTLTLGLRWARLLLQKHPSVAYQRQFAVCYCLFLVVFHCGVFTSWWNCCFAGASTLEKRQDEADSEWWLSVLALTTEHYKCPSQSAYWQICAFLYDRLPEKEEWTWTLMSFLLNNKVFNLINVL